MGIAKRIILNPIFRFKVTSNQGWKDESADQVLPLKALDLLLGSSVHPPNTRQPMSTTTVSGNRCRSIPELTSHLVYLAKIAISDSSKHYNKKKLETNRQIHLKSNSDCLPMYTHG